MCGTVVSAQYHEEDGKKTVAAAAAAETTDDMIDQWLREQQQPHSNAGRTAFQANRDSWAGAVDMSGMGIYSKRVVDQPIGAYVNRLVGMGIAIV